MLKKFRRRFIVLSMLLAGIVLLMSFVLIGAAIYRNDYAELKNTMSIVLKPWNASDEMHHSAVRRAEQEMQNAVSSEDDNEKDRDKPDNKPPARPDDARGNEPDTFRNDNSQKTKNNETDKSAAKHRQNDNITTIFYYPAEKRVSVISESLSFDGDVDTIVSEIVEQSDNFGTLGQHHVIYYKEKTEGIYKMAVTDVSYIGSHMFRIVIILSIAFLLSIGLLLLITLKMSKFAVQPLETAIEMERKFVADISHDLKTPITVILANNSILKSNPSTRVSDNQQWIDSTDHAAEDMMHLISEMLTMSALESPQKTIATESVNLTSCAQRCILQFESVAYERQISLEDNIGEGLMVQATEDYLKRICSSLIENALKYEPADGRVIVEAFSRRKKVCFVVRNTHSRIAPEDLPHIFDRFYRGDKTRRLSGGHGLGLPIIRQMANLIGAAITAESSEETGTVFTVCFNPNGQEVPRL